MGERKKRGRLCAFVATGLVVVGLLGLRSSVWATPAQEQLHQTVPPIKTVNETTVSPGDEVVFRILFAFPQAWTDVRVIDYIHPYLRVDNVILRLDDVIPPPGSWTWDYEPVSNRVTITIPSLPANTVVTIRIRCTVGDTGPGEHLICNVACDTVEGYFVHCSNPVCLHVEVEVEEFVPEPGSVLLLGSGLAGLGAYAGIGWRQRRK